MATAPTLADASRIAALDATTYAADFPAAYCIGSVPHGGFVATCFLRVAQAHLAGRGQPDTVVAHVEYLQRTEVGPAVFVVEEVKTGARTSVVHVTLFQHGLGRTKAPWRTARSRRVAAAYLTNSDLRQEEGLTLPTGFRVWEEKSGGSGELSLPSSPSSSSPPPPPPVDLVRLGRDGADDHWTRLPVAVDRYRAVLGRTEFYIPQPDGDAPPRQPRQRAVIDLWIRLASGERFTNPLLGFVADVWPYLVESYRGGTTADGTPFFDAAQVFWYPTLALNLDVKAALPAAGVEWLFVRVATKQIRHGRLDLEVLILDADGQLVALSHHVSLILDAARNLAERSHQKGEQEPVKSSL